MFQNSLRKYQFNLTSTCNAIFLGLVIHPWALGSELTGRWLQTCQAGSERMEFIADHHAQFFEKAFRDASCTQPLSTLISSGPITLGDPVETPSGASRIDFYFSKVQLVLHLSQVVDNFNSNSVCGYSHWRLNTPVDITGLRCDLFGTGTSSQIPQQGDMRYGIYLVQKFDAAPKAHPEKRLYFGKLTPERNARSEETRPDTLDDRFYIKLGN